MCCPTKARRSRSASGRAGGRRCSSGPRSRPARGRRPSAGRPASAPRAADADERDLAAALEIGVHRGIQPHRSPGPQDIGRDCRWRCRPPNGSQTAGSGMSVVDGVDVVREVDGLALDRRKARCSSSRHPSARRRSRGSAGRSPAGPRCRWPHRRCGRAPPARHRSALGRRRGLRAPRREPGGRRHSRRRRDRRSATSPARPWRAAEATCGDGPLASSRRRVDHGRGALVAARIAARRHRASVNRVRGSARAPRDGRSSRTSPARRARR